MAKVDLTVCASSSGNFPVLSDIFIRMPNVISMPSFHAAINCSGARLLTTHSLEGKVAEVRDTVDDITYDEPQS